MADPSESVPPESRLIHDRYWILSTLGAGGMGITYRVWDSEQRIPAVVKEPRAHARSEEESRRRFVQELHAMLALKHEHIVPITDYGDDGETPFVVMRFLPGGSLADYRRHDASGAGQPTPAPVLHCWLPGIAAALDFVHGSGVLHRDVKPDNIFFDAFLKAFLGDFGIAKAAGDSGRLLRGDQLTGEMTAIGTAAYMAPEQFLQGEPVTARSDQYALAVTVYEMLSGHLPFTGDPAQVAVAHVKLPPPPLDPTALGIPASVSAAVCRGLAKNPRDRFASCGDFARAVLADVPPLRLDPDTARFLCPKCGTIIRLARSRAGDAGRCAKCRAVLEIAADLSALWLRDETQRPKRSREHEPVDGGAPRRTGPDREAAWPGSEVVRRRAGAVVEWLASVGTAAVVAAAIAAAFAWSVNEVRWRGSTDVRLDAAEAQALKSATEARLRSQELDRANLRIGELERELENLRRRIRGPKPDDDDP